MVMKYAKVSALAMSMVLGLSGCASESQADSEVETSSTSQIVKAVHLNQHGFLPKRSKIAIAVTDAKQPLEWQLQTGAGETLASGLSVPFGINTGSEAHVHQIDFSEYTGSGDGLQLVLNGTKSHPFTISENVYGQLRYDVASFYYHQRSGTPIEAKYAGGEKWARPAGHAPDTATCYGPEDVFGNIWSGCDYTLDVSKGWYDAGDQGKYVVNSGVTVWTLLNYYERSLSNPSASKAVADGMFSIPERENQVPDLLDEVRWNLEFMLAMQVPDGTKMRLPRGDQRIRDGKLEFTDFDVTGMVHHKVHDEHWTAMVMPPHLDPETRYLMYPSTAATLNLAAVGAQCARLWKDIDPAFSAQCLSASKKAYKAAKNIPDVWAYTVTGGGGGGYGDRRVDDEFSWAATELYITTGESEYEKDMRASDVHLATPPATTDGRGDISWNTVDTLGTISLAVAPSGVPSADQTAARKALVGTADRYVAQTKSQGYRLAFSRPYTWGSNSDFSNRGIIFALAHDFTGDEKYRTSAIDMMDYMLGRNPIDQSYISGYGENPMLHPHHRFWAHSLSDDLPPPPPGALSGGANFNRPADPIARKIYENCKPQTCFKDHVESYSMNEVAINWNAPLFWLSAYLGE